MFDRLTRAERSALMASIRKTDTRPELSVRRVAHSMGYRYRLHRRDLPGTPDLTFPKWRKVIQVHGCFWHQHNCRLGRRRPTTNLDYWSPKLERNKIRDRKNRAKLRRMGWDTLVIWECQVGNLEFVRTRIRKFFGD